jgi:hypothetical protein
MQAEFIFVKEISRGKVAGKIQRFRLFLPNKITFFGKHELNL